MTKRSRIRSQREFNVARRDVEADGDGTRRWERVELVSAKSFGQRPPPRCSKEAHPDRRRRRFTAEFKAKVALEALQGQRTIAELATRHELHPNVITQWRRQAIEKLARVFDDKWIRPATGRDRLLRHPGGLCVSVI